MAYKSRPRGRAAAAERERLGIKPEATVRRMVALVAGTSDFHDDAELRDLGFGSLEVSLLERALGRYATRRAPGDVHLTFEPSNTVKDVIEQVAAGMQLRRCPAGHATSGNPCPRHRLPTKGWTDP